MSSYACIVFYGLRFEIHPDKIEELENRSDARILSARKAGLKSYWGNFGAPEERYLLFVGAKLAVLGPENASEMIVSSPDLQAIAESTKIKLQKAGLSGDPALYLQWEQDV